jgi:hypothetical protein
LRLIYVRGPRAGRPIERPASAAVLPPGRPARLPSRWRGILGVLAVLAALTLAAPSASLASGPGDANAAYGYPYADGAAGSRPQLDRRASDGARLATAAGGRAQ